MMTITQVNKKTQTIWDPLVRLVHWNLVLFFCLAYGLGGDRLDLHSNAGYTIGLLILFRLVWGFIGSRHARFANFVTPPSQTLAYLARLLQGDAKPYTGHDPAGSAMIVTLLISLLITVFTGMSLFGMEGSGPLANTFVNDWQGYLLEEIHSVLADLTLLLIIVHITGMLFTSRVHHENLTKAMITGRKRQPALSNQQKSNQQKHSEDQS